MNFLVIFSPFLCVCLLFLVLLLFSNFPVSVLNRERKKVERGVLGKIFEEMVGKKHLTK